MFVARAITRFKASRRSSVQWHGQEKMKASMVLVPKALIHQICLPSISIHHFDQSKSKGLRLVPQRNLSPWSNTIKGSSLIHHFMHIWTYLSVLNHQFIKDMSYGLEKLINQFIWLFWNALRPNFLCVGQIEMNPREKMFLRTIWTTFMFIKIWFEACKVIFHSKTL